MQQKAHATLRKGSLLTADDDGRDECRALRLENQNLRCRIRELESANAELLVLAGLAPPVESSSSTAPVPEDTTDAANTNDASQESKSETAICPNCGRNVPCNYEAHVIHCERNFYRCKACDEVIPLRAKEEHHTRWTDQTWALRAAREGDLPSLRGMRAHGTKFEDMTYEDTSETMLHVAAAQGSVELLSLLFSRGAPSTSWQNCLNRNGQSALHVAVASGHENVAELLLGNKADVDQKNAAGDTALLIACRGGVAHIVRRLADANADLTVKTTLGDTALQVAQRNGHMDCSLALGVRRRGSDASATSEADVDSAMPPLRHSSRGSAPAGRSAPPTSAGLCSGTLSGKQS